MRPKLSILVLAWALLCLHHFAALADFTKAGSLLARPPAGEASTRTMGDSCNYNFDLPSVITACIGDSFPCFNAPAGFVISEVYQNGTLVSTNPAVYCPDSSGYYTYVIYDSLTGCVYSDSVSYQNVRCPCDIKPKWDWAMDSVCAVRFTDLSYLSGGNVVGWLWNFGDGTTSTLQNPQHVYTHNGNYTVCLTLVGLVGEECCTDTLCREVKVTCAMDTCTADARWQFALDSCHCSLHFSANENQPGLVSYLWSFGDSTISTLTNPTHSYAHPGSYTVCLTVVVIRDGACCVDTVCKKIDVNCESNDSDTSKYEHACFGCPCHVTAKWSVGVQVGCSVVFTDLSVSSSNIIGWFWDFGDGTTSTLQHPQHLFPHSGTYTVCLTVVSVSGGKCCYDRHCDLVRVECSPLGCEPKPEIVFVFDTCACSFSFQAINLHPALHTAYFWEFGDGTTSTEQYPIHAYASPGSYTVCLTLVEYSNDGCCTKKICKQLNVYCAPHVAHRIADAEGFADLLVAPNPLNGGALISFTLRHDATVSLRITNILGQTVWSRFVNQPLNAGQHAVRFDATGLPSGIYVCEMNDGYKKQQVRLIVNR